MKTIYICNVCGEEHLDQQDAIECHPNIIERKVCRECGVNWDIDSDSFGCWNCGYDRTTPE